MKLRYLIGLILLLTVCSVGGYGQAALGFTSPNGFPQVINQGSHYNLEGWIVNRGNVAYSGTLEIDLLADSGAVLSVDNNFQVSSLLQPGDSVYWSRSNYTFPPGHFRAGNNDVLIWPTAPLGSDVDVDTVTTSVYFTEGSAFRLSSDGFQQLAAGVCLTCEFDFDLRAENESAIANAADVCLFVSVPGHAPRCVSLEHHIIEQYEVAEFSRHHFSLWNALGLQASDSLSGQLDAAEFFVLESGSTMQPMNRVSIPVLAKPLGQVDPAAQAQITVFPNPFSAQLHVQVPQSWRADAQLVMSDLSGRVVFAGALANLPTDWSSLAAGSYLLEVRSSKGVAHQQVIKN